MENITLGEAANRFVSSLSATEREEKMPEVTKFARWYGWNRLMAELTAPEVSGYAERAVAPGPEAKQKIESVKAFLSYARKEGLTQTNLATHLKVKKGPGKQVSSRDDKAGRSEGITAEGYHKIKTELEDLRSERPRMAEELQLAAADKDVRENAPLEAARERQGQLEARIRQLEVTLKSAVVMQKEDRAARIDSGDTVVMRDLESGEQFRYTLVHPSEVDASKGKISSASVTGRALLGKTEGEVIEVIAPLGVLRYRIEAIER